MPSAIAKIDNTVIADSDDTIKVEGIGGWIKLENKINRLRLCLHIQRMFALKAPKFVQPLETNNQGLAQLR